MKKEVKTEAETALLHLRFAAEHTTTNVQEYHDILRDYTIVRGAINHEINDKVYYVLKDKSIYKYLNIQEADILDRAMHPSIPYYTTYTDIIQMASRFDTIEEAIEMVNNVPGDVAIVRIIITEEVIK